MPRPQQDHSAAYRAILDADATRDQERRLSRWVPPWVGYVIGLAGALAVAWLAGAVLLGLVG